MSPETIDAINRLIQTIGVGRSLWVAGGAGVLVVGFYIWRSRQGDAAHKAVIAAKDETIERIVGQNRDLRFEIFRLQNVPIEKAHILAYDKLLMTAEVKEGNMRQLGAVEKKGKKL